MGSGFKARATRLFASRFGVSLVGVVVVAGVLVGVAIAQEEPTTYSACLTNRGMLSAVAIGDDPLRACRTSETEISWNSEGPPGPQGDPGSEGPVGQQGPAGPQGPAGLGAIVDAGTCTLPAMEFQLVATCEFAFEFAVPPIVTMTRAENGASSLWIDSTSTTGFVVTAGSITTSPQVINYIAVQMPVAPEPTECSPMDAIAYWCFDDMADPTSGGINGHDADLFGATFETADIPPVEGNVAALRLDGIDDYGFVPDPGGDANLDGFDAITMAAWVNPSGVQQSNGCCGGIVTKYASGSAISYGLDIQDDELRFVYIGDEFSTSGVDLALGEWAHVAGTWDGTTIRLYVNGVEEASASGLFSSIADNSVAVNIGAFEAFASGDRAAFFDGLIDEVYIFDRALTATEIAELAAS